MRTSAPTKTPSHGIVTHACPLCGTPTELPENWLAFGIFAECPACGRLASNQCRTCGDTFVYRRRDYLQHRCPTCAAALRQGST